MMSQDSPLYLIIIPPRASPLDSFSPTFDNRLSATLCMYSVLGDWLIATPISSVVSLALVLHISKARFTVSISSSASSQGGIPVIMEFHLLCAAYISGEWMISMPNASEAFFIVKLNILLILPMRREPKLILFTASYSPVTHQNIVLRVV